MVAHAYHGNAEMDLTRFGHPYLLGSASGQAKKKYRVKETQYEPKVNTFGNDLEVGICHDGFGLIVGDANRPPKCLA
jgi:hypothetical protein